MQYTQDYDERLPMEYYDATYDGNGDGSPDNAAQPFKNDSWQRMIFPCTSLEFGDVVAANQTVSLPAKSPDKNFPRALMGGATLKLVLPALGNGPRFLRLRGAYRATNAGLSVGFGGATLWNEKFNYLDAGGAGNFAAPDLAGVAAEFTRLIFLPPNGDVSTLTLGNAGSEPLYFDALQIEARPEGAPQMLIGLNNGFSQSFGSKNAVPVELSSQWGSMRAVLRTGFVGAPDDPKRWKKIDEIMQSYLAMKVPLQVLFEGTPAWCAIDTERYKNNDRPTAVPPDPVKYANEIVAPIIQKYGDHIESYELWNEANSRKYWRGPDEEYVAFVNAVAPVIRKLDPTATIQTTGMAGYSEPFFNAMIKGGNMPLIDWVSYHAYASKSTAWDISYGQMEGALFAAGLNKVLNVNEQGVTWRNAEWFVPPPNFSPEVQADWLDKSMARLMSNGVTKESTFHAGGDTHEYGLIDENGVPRPGLRPGKAYGADLKRAGLKRGKAHALTSAQRTPGFVLFGAQHKASC